MADKISVDELKIFVNVGLCFMDTHKDITSELWSVERFGFEIVNGGGEWPIEHCGVSFKPIVSPLSQLTVKDIKEITGFTKSGTAVTAFIKNIKEGRIYLSHAQKLAAKRYDIFNWLNRTGEDGSSLAVEMCVTMHQP